MCIFVFIFHLQINEAAYFLYDAVMLYAYGLNATLSKGGSITDGKAIIDEILEQGTYQSECSTSVYQYIAYTCITYAHNLGKA